MSQLVTIINDCLDDNARTRQVARYHGLLENISTNFCGVESSLKAQGDLIDTIDAYKDAPGIISINVALRGNKEKYLNGIPFCFCRLGKLLILGTPNCFPLAKKLGLFSKVYETDVFEVCSKFLDHDEALRISNSQFRSFEYLPYLAKWLSEGEDVPAKEVDVEDFGEKNFVWRVDNFGNCKTTLIENESHFMKDLEFYERLADVPKDGKPALTRGSSGFGEKRFLEIIVQNESASDKLGLKVGSII